MLVQGTPGNDTNLSGIVLSPRVIFANKLEHQVTLYRPSMDDRGESILQINNY